MKPRASRLRLGSLPLDLASPEGAGLARERPFAAANLCCPDNQYPYITARFERGLT